MNLGTENRKQIIAVIVLGCLLLVIVAYEVMTSFSTNASTAPTYATTEPEPSAAKAPHAARRSAATNTGKKPRPAQDLDPTLHLQQLAATEQIQYEGSGRNIFVAEADPVIPTPQGNGTTDKGNQPAVWQPPAIASAPPIPLKFFGFASHAGEPKRIFLSKGDDVFIAGEGEIVDRRYKVLRISPNSVEMQDVVGSGAPQTIPLTQG